MSSGLKSLIAVAAAAVLLGGGVAVMKLTEPDEAAEKDDTAIAEEETVADIYSGDVNNLVSVEVKNSTGGYTVKRTAAATDETQAVFDIAGLEGIARDDSLVSSFGQNASTLTPVMVVDENPSDLSNFGLDKPAAEVTLTFDGSDAQKVTLLVGNDTPGGDRYVKLKDLPAVYTASASFIKSYTYEEEYFISKVILAEPDADDYPVVKKITIERPDLEKPVVFEYTGENASGGTTATHVMTSPVKAYLDVSSSVDYTHGLFGLNAASVLSVHPSESELAVAGITAPSSTVTMTLEDGKVYKLRTGISYTGEEGSQKGYTGYFEGTDILWKFNDYDVPWVTVKPDDVMSSLVFGSYIYDLKSLEITAGGKTEKFEFTGSDEESYSVKLNGNGFDLERYKSFYQAVIKAPAEEICTSDEGIGNLIASFTLKYNNGNPEEKIEFFEADGNKVIIKKDGEVCFKCHASFVNKSLLPNISAVEGTSDFVTVW